MLAFDRNPNWWRGSIRLEICLLLVPLFPFSALAQMYPNKTAVIQENRYPSIRYQCQSNKLIPTTVAVLKKIKPAIKPCNDFYQFACGKFIDETKIPPNAKYVDVNAVTSVPFKIKISQILREERPETEPKHYRFPYNFFKACMNTALIDDLGTRPLQAVTDYLGGWPVVIGESWNPSDSWSWQDLAKKLRRLGFSSDYIMTFGLVEAKVAPTRYYVELRQPTLALQSNFHETSWRAYYDYMVDIAIYLGANKAAAKRQLHMSLTLERDLVQCKKSLEGYYLLTIKMLQDTYPYVQWLDFINSFLPEGHVVDDNQIIKLWAPSFFTCLGGLLQQADKRTLANYMMWKFHQHSLPFLPERFRRRQLHFKAAVQGRSIQEDRYQNCVTMTSNNLAIALSSLYIQKYIKQTSREAAKEIFENIRGAFNQTLEESQWLDGETKKEAQRKLNSLQAVIGFPDEMFDNNRIEDYYRELEFDPNKYFQSYLNISVFNLDKKFGKLKLPVNETKWLRSICIDKSSPFCNLMQNTIYITATVLQDNLINIERPNYMNYGFIGSTIAHEMIHNFWSHGLMFDADCRKRYWCQPVSEQALSEKAKCLIEQYDNFTDMQTGLKIDGNRTLEENIADNSGIKMAYLAYKQWLARHGEEQRLPGLKYTSLQMFWISFAQKWCGKFTPDKMKEIIATDWHSPYEFRVLGTLRNMKDFSRDFHCPENSPMNPVQKCEVW